MDFLILGALATALGSVGIVMLWIVVLSGLADVTAWLWSNLGCLAAAFVVWTLRRPVRFAWHQIRAQRQARRAAAAAELEVRIEREIVAEFMSPRSLLDIVRPSA